MKIPQIQKIIRSSRPDLKLIPFVIFFLIVYTLFTGIRIVLYTFLVDEVAIAGQVNLFAKLLILIILTNVIRMLAPFYYHYLLEIFTNKMRFNLYLNITRHIQKLPLKYFRETNSAYLSNRVVTDIDTLINTICMRIFEFLASLFTLVIYIFVAFNLNWKMGFVLIVLQPFYLYFVKIGSKKIHNYSSTLQEAKPLFVKHLQESFAGIGEIKSYNFQPFSLISVGKMLKKYIFSILDLNIYTQFYNAYCGMVLLGVVNFLAFDLLGVYLILKKELTIGGLFAFQLIIPSIIGPLRGIIDINIALQMALVSMKRIIAIFDEKGEQLSGVRLRKPIDKIIFDNVSFSYNNNQILRNISFEISRGEKIALVGRTGAGKTTLVNMLLKFLTPDTGKIFINDVEINDLDANYLRSKIAMVPQNVYLFNKTIRDNLIIGNPSANNDDLYKTINSSGLKEIINHLPQGINTKVGEMGVNLSGGERQRIGIARALLRNPDILIIDEALSQVDSNTEAFINKTIEDLFKDKIVIIVAHRLSTIKNCDRILVLSNSKIVAIGDHNTLFQTSKEYQELYKEQVLIE